MTFELRRKRMIVALQFENRAWERYRASKTPRNRRLWKQRHEAATRILNLVHPLFEGAKIVHDKRREAQSPLN